MSIVTLESQKKFSESLLWEMQRKYFEQQGINAWVKQVPFYVTSNPYIANIYANVAVRFIQDWCRQHPDAKNHPFYIMELGTGSGRFSFYVLKKIDELLEQLQLNDISVCYIMSDFTESNIRYWNDHDALKKYFDKGMLDVAVYNLEEDDQITLMHQNIVLSSDTLKNPLTIFGNYIFDTISHDMFKVSDGQISEMLISLSTDGSNMIDNLPKNWDDVKIDHTAKPIEGQYYDDPDIEAVLQNYKHQLKNSNFLIPIASLRAIKKMTQMSNNRLFLIASDKSYAHLKELENLNIPRLAFHGSFSMMVNFHAMGEYFKQCGGDAFYQTLRKGIKTCVFTQGFQLEQLPETKAAIDACVQNLSPADYFILHRNVSENFSNYKLETLASHLAFTGYDPHIFNKLSRYICNNINNTDAVTVRYLCDIMDKIAENYYYLPQTPDIFFNIAVFFHTLKRYDKAVVYYQQSEHYYGVQFTLKYNIALCLYHTGNYNKSLAQFREALELSPQSKETKEWIEFIEKERSSAR